MADKMINATVKNEDELFTFVSNDSIESEKIIAPRYSYWRSVFRVFFRKKRRKKPCSVHLIRQDSWHCSRSMRMP